ncbi:MAG: cysteine-rich CWC family protein [Bdellovibrionota bacterium]
MAKKICERCHSEFDCGAANDEAAGGNLPCWCLQLPLAQNIPKNFSDCLCAKCLNEFINIQTSAPTNEPDYYFDTNGLMVFSQAYHLKRGCCCGSGCRHCPY